MSVFNILYILATGGHIVALGAVLGSKNQLAKIFLLFATVMALSAYVAIWFIANRPPLYGVFESVMTIVGVIPLLMFFTGRLSISRNPRSDQTVVTSLACGVSLTLLLLLGWFPRTLNSDYFMYAEIPVMVFFHGRILAASIIICSSIICWHDFSQQRWSRSRQSRNILLVGALFFLISEMSGSWWCQIGWGDSWHWSRGFLKAATFFMVIMLICHFPSAWHRHMVTWPILATVPSFVILWVLLVH